MSKKSFGHIEIPLKRIHIELTNICDFNCIFCPKSEMKRSYGQMDTGLAKRIIKEIGSNGLSEKITFHVMGEPTLHRNFFEILEYAQKEKVNVGLTTNGGGLGGETGKRLLDYPLHQIDVSLQTPDENSFAMRKAGSLSFEDYLGGILNFFSSYKTKNKKTVFKFRFFNTRFQNKALEQKVGPIRVMSSTKELRDTFSYWTERISDVLNVEKEMKEQALKRINSLVSYKWNVVEVLPEVFFETYLLSNWANAFNDKNIRDAWGGYCFGMRDHFSILYNGDLTLCCVDYEGKTAIGNLHKSSLKEILSSEKLGKIIDGFKKFKLVHPYCKFCLGSKTFTSWLFKPILTILSLKLLKPFFYAKVKLD